MDAAVKPPSYYDRHMDDQQQPQPQMHEHESGGQLAVASREEFSCLSIIGEGSISAVYSATWKKGGRNIPVAIKTPRLARSHGNSSSNHVNIETSTAAQNDILGEVDLQMRLPVHSSIVRPLATTVLQPNPNVRRYQFAMVTHLWPDGTLDALLSRGEVMFHADDVERVLRCLCRAIGAFASVNLAHCDLSPRNVVLRLKTIQEPDLQARLAIDTAAVIDFNLMRPLNYRLREDQIAARRERSYNAPDEVITEKTDIYSLGELCRRSCDLCT